jgi:hypothetical protein
VHLEFQEVQTLVAVIIVFSGRSCKGRCTVIILKYKIFTQCLALQRKAGQDVGACLGYVWRPRVRGIFLGYTRLLFLSDTGNIFHLSICSQLMIDEGEAVPTWYR